ncbi:phage tail assembly protein [Bradyrhizobium sp. 613_E4_N2_2]|uniref:phage tail assembly protein n=1 Tax=Bradyrhizobium sp. 613_E4_N2_2 TaxID=3240371 RepID=UPI003F89382A
MSDTPEYIIVDGSEAVITLTDGKTVTMREPKVLDMRAAQKSSKSAEDTELKMFGDLCQMTPAELDQLSIKNYGRLQEAFKLFMS